MASFDVYSYGADDVVSVYAIAMVWVVFLGAE